MGNSSRSVSYIDVNVAPGDIATRHMDVGERFLLEVLAEYRLVHHAVESL